MKYVMVYGAGRRGSAWLEQGASRVSVAAECRYAALHLVNGAQDWTKADLAAWLSGPYARATRHTQRGERTLMMRGVALTAASVEPPAIHELLASTRLHMLASLQKVVSAGASLEFIDGAVERGLVQRARDEASAEVWIPVDRARLRLLDRIRGLFVADYLNDPMAYQEDLYVCPLCSSVAFDRAAKAVGMCAAHRHTSSIVVKGSPVVLSLAANDD